MSIINRYIFFQFFPSFLVGYGFFTLVQMIPFIRRLVSLTIEKGIPFTSTLELFFYLIPAISVLTVPMGVLFSGLLTLGRLSGDNELLALRANGFSVLKIARPAFIYGILMSIVMFWFMNYIVPISNHRYKLLLTNASLSNPSLFLENKDFKEIPNTDKKITSLEYDSKSQTMKDVYLYEKNDKNEISLISAKQGKWLNNEINSKNIKLKLNNGEIIHFSVDDNKIIDVSDFDELLINLQSQITQYEQLDKGLREISAFEVADLIEDKQGKNQEVEPVFFVEYHKKISLPVSCFFFIFVAIPLSITLNNRSGKGVSFGIALVIIFIYNLFLIMGETFAKKDIISPSIGMYIPNIVIFLIGFVYFSKIIRK